MAANSAANRTPAGIHADRVRGIFGMSSGAHSSTSDSATLRKMYATTESTAATQAANDNRMMAEMQLQTKLLKSIANNSKGFGLTDFLMGSWLSKLGAWAVGGVLAGVGSAKTAAGKAAMGLKTVLASAAAGTATLIKGTVLGVFRPIVSGMQAIFKPLAAVGRSISGMLRVPSIAGALTGMVKAAPNMLKVFGGLASKIFLPLTAIMGAIDGIGGALNAEKILGKSKVNIFDRMVAGLGSVINGVMLGIPDWIAQRFGVNNFASVLDKGASAIGSAVTNIAGWVTDNIGKFVNQVKSYLPSAVELVSRFGNFIKDGAFKVGGFIKEQFLATVDNLKRWIPPAGQIGATIGQFVAGKIGEFGTFIGNSIGGVFSKVGEWAQQGFENLKAEIAKWAPWNWNINGVEQGRAYGQQQMTNQNNAMARMYGPSAGTRMGALVGGGVIRPSNQSSPIVRAAGSSPYDMYRLSAAMGPGANDALPVVGAVVATGVATQEILQNNAIGQTETFAEAMEKVVENHEESMDKATEGMVENFVDKLGGALAALGLAYKPIADVMSALPGEVVRYLQQHGQAGSMGSIPGFMQGLTSLGTGGAAPTSSAAPYVNPPAPTVSNQSGITVPGGAVGVPGSSAIKDSAGRVISTATTTMTPEQRALLDTIAMGNATSGQNYWESPDYNTIVGGGSFTGYGDHPRIFGTPDSTAAGRYQFTKTTWDDTVNRYNQANPNNPITDFSPGNQDRAALFLASQDYRRRTGRNLEADLQSGAINGQLIQQGLGGVGNNTTWQIFQKKGANDITNAYNTNLERNRGYAATPAAPSGPISGDLPESVRNMRVSVGDGTTKTLGELGVTTYADLQTKGGQAFDGGANDPSTTYITSKIAENLGDNFNRVTAQNDGTSHAGGPNSHGAGVKTDFTVRDGNYPGAHAQIDQFLAGQGLVAGQDYKIISRPHGSGPHIDFALLPSGRQKVEQMRAAEQAATQAPVNVPQVATPAGVPMGSDPVGSGQGSWFDFGSKFYDVNSQQGRTIADFNRIYGANRGRPRTPMSMGVNGSYAGQDRGRITPRSAPTSIVGGSDLGLGMNPFTGEMPKTIYHPQFGFIDSSMNTSFSPAHGAAIPTNANKMLGTGFDTPDSIGKAIGQGIVDATVPTVRQPTVVPMDSANPLAPTAPAAAGSSISANPTGTPKPSVNEKPDINSVDTIGEFKLLLINSDMMG